MCCFSKPVDHVSGTSIFARTTGASRQFLVYSMSIQSKEDLAMVLPLPVKPGTDEEGVSFIDLKEYPDFFDDLKRGFLEPRWREVASLRVAQSSGELRVVQVGAFEASFVPTVKDFSRLDERFRLPEGAWKNLPGYRDFGFAVFKLKQGALKVHPMAFSFPRRDAKSLFFPTVHIHDGQAHSEADFDHQLYCQPQENQHLALEGWQESLGHTGSFMKMDKAKGLIKADQHCYTKQMKGSLANRDTFLGIDG
jgi:hypothetical protein